MCTGCHTYAQNGTDLIMLDNLLGVSIQKINNQFSEHQSIFQEIFLTFNITESHMQIP